MGNGSVQCLHCAKCCCYRRVRECAVFALCKLLLLQKGAGVCNVCTVPAVVVTEGCGSVQCLHCASCCCYRRVRECAVFALCQLLLLQKGAGVCSVCTVPTVVVTEGCGSVQCLHCASCCCYRRVRECAVFALCQLLLQKGAGVCSVCTVPTVVVKEGCGSVQCLHCASCCCYRRVRECAVFALCQLLLLQKGAGVCSVCTVPTVVVTEGCGSVQCLHCASCCC